jgi:hypothetical protein
MSTPNPFLVAGAPELIVVLQALQTFVTTVTSGDPLTAPARVVPAFDIFKGTVALQAPALAAAELGAAGTAANASIESWITKIQAATVPTKPA